MCKYLLFFFLSVTFVGCQSEPVSTNSSPANSQNTPPTTSPVVPKKARQPIRISGTISNPTADEIFLTKGRQQQRSAVRNGKFQLQQMVSERASYKLKYNGQVIPLHLAPGDELELSFDGFQVDKQLRFSGASDKVQKYLQEKKAQSFKNYTERRKAVTLPEAEFMKQTDEALKQQQDFLENHLFANPGLPADFIVHEKAEILYDWAKQYQDYKLYRAFYNQREEYTPSADLLAFTDRLNLNDPASLSSDYYRNFLIAHVSEKASALVQKDLMEGKKIASTRHAFDLTEASHNHPLVQNYLLYFFLKNHLKSSGINDAAALYERFKNNVTDAQYREEIDNEFLKWQPLLAGNPAPGFAYPDSKGKVVDLKDFRGKVVYIDVWATWCGPCKTEIPHLEKLQENFEGQPVAFLSVSIDNNVAAWEKMLKDKNMKGVQLIADQAGNSKICQDYKIQGIPRFLLIDQAGKIVDVQADRPSGGHIAEEIQGLLNNG